MKDTEVCLQMAGGRKWHSDVLNYCWEELLGQKGELKFHVFSRNQKSVTSIRCFWKHVCGFLAETQRVMGPFGPLASVLFSGWCSVSWWCVLAVPGLRFQLVSMFLICLFSSCPILMCCTCFKFCLSIECFSQLVPCFRSCAPLCFGLSRLICLSHHVF